MSHYKKCQDKKNKVKDQVEEVMARVSHGLGSTSPTLEAATSCAVLAAISWEQAITSSYLPWPELILSAESLEGQQCVLNMYVWPICYHGLFHITNDTNCYNHIHFICLHTIFDDE